MEVQQTKMTRRVVVSCFGDQQSADTIHHLAATAEVVAVAFDFGGRTTLADMREMALAAGAIRCHVLDVREEFARDALLPALRRGAVTNPNHAEGALAMTFVRRKLEEIARLENALVEPPASVTVPTRLSSREVIPPQYLHIGFNGDVPVSINGVDMTLSELIESLETITGEPALAVLDREMARFLEPQLA